MQKLIILNSDSLHTLSYILKYHRFYHVITVLMFCAVVSFEWPPIACEHCCSKWFCTTTFHGYVFFEETMTAISILDNNKLVFLNCHCFTNVGQKLAMTASCCESLHSHVVFNCADRKSVV